MSQTQSKKRSSDSSGGAKVFVYFSDFLKGFKKFWWMLIVCAIIVGTKIKTSTNLAATEN